MTISIALLTKLGDFSKEACAFRLKVAILYSGISHTDLADRSSVGKSSITNMLKADQFTNRSVEDYFYQAHGIDYNFLRAGDIRALSSEIKEKMILTARELTSN